MNDKSFKIERVGIIGCGLMGAGIAEVSALRGYPTVLVKATDGEHAPTRRKMERSLRKRVDRGKLEVRAMEEALDRLVVTRDREALGESDLVIESIVEDLESKQALLDDLAVRLDPSAILASNTSTLKIRDLTPEGCEARTLGLHFFSPVQAMSLVEVAYTDETDAKALAAAEQFVERIGKTPVRVSDSTGFIVNRLLVPYLVNAIAAYGQGLAPAPQIDTAMKLGCGHPVGPLALSDLIGLDVVFSMAKLLHKDLGDGACKPPALLRRMVQDGNLGKKTGLGFYDYSMKPPVPNQAIWELIQGEVTHAEPDEPYAA